MVNGRTTSLSANPEVEEKSLKVYYVLDYILFQVQGDERPYVTVSIFGQKFLGFLDSGASRTVVGGKGWNVLQKLSLVKLEKSNLNNVTVANGENCVCLGILRVAVALQSVEKIIDILVIPGLPHVFILGIDFWRQIGVVPDLRSREFKITNSNSFIDSSLSLLTSAKNKIHDDIVSSTFIEMGNNLGCTKVVEHKIKTKGGVEPIKQRFYLVSPMLMKHIHEELRTMLENGIIERSDSPRNSTIVKAKKKDNSYRFCVDFRKVNAVTLSDAYPLPYVTHTLDKLRDAQIPLEKESRAVTTFTVPGRGLFHFKRLPFGVHTAPATWQRLMDQVLSVDLEPFVFIYLDDIVVVTQTFDKHIEILREVFLRHIKVELTHRKEKYQFCRKELRYLRYVDMSGLHVDPEKVIAILQISTPTKISEVHGFLGTASWYIFPF